ncbi:carbohydrate ABC transporter permease [Clostridium fessum]|uniref:carbohydrate ABC transporter permease n=1 Tax=Clostridium fessum TaxID=2126740 RepID=UPI002A829ECA|nr:carbohydrate ABC transporter permease [Clostridium fessum]MDD6324404.1 carbohydrate ABC transporter permease [Lachnospiraceae bacterium]MDY4928163.1 carbohydrate ABC transporter permease [Clostridium fessum]
MQEKKKVVDIVIYVVLTVLAVAFLVPIALVIMNSLKSKLYISTTPFVLPNEENFVGLKNYVEGLTKIHFFDSVGYSLFITVFSVLAIVIFCSMTAWFITRVKTKLTSAIYYMFIASMVVPFQMVMYTMTKTADVLKLNNYVGIIVIYLGFGAAMAVFMFSGFVNGIPMELEEAALIDGCNPLTMFIKVVFPMLKPISITVAILNAMWIWNDYLLPYLLIGTKYRTIPVAIQYLKSGYGSIDYGHLMAAIVVALIPIVVFYFACQKYIIEGIVDGAVKG